MRQVIEVKGKKKELFELNKKKVTNPYYEDQRHRYRVFNGHLEKVIDKGLPAYDDLVWKNFFYGKVKKHKIKNFKFRSSSKNPTHSMHPDVFSDLEKLVDFPAVVKKLYRTKP